MRAAWSTRPADDRPLLLALGESLGAYGGQGAFGSLDDMAAEVDGAVWVGTPRFTPLWTEIIAGRDAGSPEKVPVVDGCAVVCFASDPDDLGGDAGPTVVYLQHATDPVVWWSGRLLFERPDWLEEPARPSVTSGMTWYPAVTFWQVTMDMVFSSDMPDGRGHHDGLELADAWAEVAPPPGWTADDTVRLRGELTTVDP